MKAFFLGRALREKVLMLAFALLAVVIWGSRVAGRVQNFWDDTRSAKSELAAQEIWLKNAATIDAKAAAATKNLDPAKTLNATRLVSELNGMANVAGLSADIGSQRTERTNQFAFNTVLVTFRKADLPALIKFYTELSKRTPYIGLEQFSIATNRASPGQLDATFRVVAAELGAP